LVFSNGEERQEKLTSETVEGASLTFQSVDDVHRCHGFTFGVFRVGDGISDDIFQEHFQDSASFFVDQTGNTFHAATTSQSSDSGFRDTLDVVTQDFAMTLRSSFSQSFASFTATGHLFRLFQLTQNTCTPRTLGSQLPQNFSREVRFNNKKEGEFFLFGWLYIKIRKYKGNTREEKYKKKKNTSLLFNFGDSI
jgi:hypothetical protein